MKKFRRLLRDETFHSSNLDDKKGEENSLKIIYDC